MKNILKLLILSMLFICVNVNAASYNLILEGTTNVEKNSSVDAYITIKNINGFEEGIIGCTTVLSSSPNIKINSVSGLNGWSVMYGTQISADIYPGVSTNTRIAKVNLTVNGEGTLTINNSYCSDGNIELNTSSSTINYKIKTTTTTTTKATTTMTTTTKTTTKANNTTTSTTTTKIQEKPYLNNLIIENHELNFQKDKYEYEINVVNEVDKLNINYTTSKDVTIEIKGNETFKVGVNKVDIVLTAKNGWQTTYSIKVVKEALNEYIENKEETIIHAIKQNNNIKVKVDINAQNKVITTKILKELKENKKNIIYMIYDNNNIIYSFQIFGTNINNTNPINFGIKFESDYGNNIIKLIKNIKYKIINFDYTGNLPEDTKIIIYNINMKNNGYFYYYNPNENELEYMYDIELQDSKLVLDMKHCSEYVFLEEKINDNNLYTLFIIGTLIYAVSTIIIIIIYIILSKNKKKKENILN